MANMASHTPSQRYLSSRGGSYDLSFEDVVLKGLASDGGLFIPEEIPSLPPDWQESWKDCTFEQLAYNVLSLYISPAEIPADDLREIIQQSYSTFRTPDIAPVIALDEKRNIYLLELFHGPTYAFKDVALQFLGNLFQFFLIRQGKAEGSTRQHLTVIGATSGDTGSAAIYGLRGKKDISVFILFPRGKVSAVQEAQMTTVLDANVHNVAVEGTFDDCQDFVKALFADTEINKTHRLAAINSINWARILAQIIYYFSSYFSLLRSTSDSNPSVRYVVPSGNFGDILAGYFAKRMGLPIEKLVIATNENDILHRFWQSGHYEKKPVHGREAEGGFQEDGAKAHESGVKETYSPAMDILVSSNFERLLWFMAYQVYGQGSVEEKRKIAGERVKGWLGELKTEGGFSVEPAVLEAARKDFESERVSDKQTVDIIRQVYNWDSSTLPKNYVLDPHSAVGIAAVLRSIERAPDAHHISLSTAHPAKFSIAVELALKEEKNFDFKNILPAEFVELDNLPRRVIHAKRDEGLDGIRNIIVSEVEKELAGK